MQSIELTTSDEPWRRMIFQQKTTTTIELAFCRELPLWNLRLGLATLGATKRLKSCALDGAFRWILLAFVNSHLAITWCQDSFFWTLTSPLSAWLPPTFHVKVFSPFIRSASWPTFGSEFFRFVSTVFSVGEGRNSSLDFIRFNSFDYFHFLCLYCIIRYFYLNSWIS